VITWLGASRADGLILLAGDFFADGHRRACDPDGESGRLLEALAAKIELA